MSKQTDMTRITLIACVGQKLSHRSKAADLYTSTLFKLSLKYARKQRPDDIFILSAKHGLLPLDKEIYPYEQTLNNMLSAEIKAWADEVIDQLREVCRLDETEFTFLAGEKYRRYLLPHIKHKKIPLQGLRIGEQLQRLKELCDER